METGIFVRVCLEGKWQSVDIGDEQLPDEEVCKWLRTGGNNPLAENTVMEFLGRKRCEK